MARDLCKTYPVEVGLAELVRHPFRKRPGVRALRGLSIQAEPGAVLGLLGPNGAGKTTLLKILANLVLPDAGDVTIEGWSLRDDPSEARGRVGVVFNDERSFFWRLSARENLRFFGALYDVHRSVVVERMSFYLEAFGLLGIVDRRFASYSSGQKKALAIARAMLTDPPVVLLDEPTNNLDPLMTARLKEHVRDELAHKRGKTVIWATHRLEEVGDVCDRVALLDRGSVLFDGRTDEFVRLSPGGPDGSRLGSLEQIFERLIADGRRV